jgi:hypothetical protein
MADNEKKIEKLEKSCYETAKKELKILEKENSDVYSEKINEMVEDYKESLRKKYNQEINKLSREYNREVFDYEMEEKVKLNKFKNTLIDNMKTKIEYAMHNFINTEEYENYLINNIKISMNKIKNIEDTTIYLTEKDYYKFKEKIENNFNIKFDKLENDYIGGSIIINNRERISVDNTIKTNIEEKIKQIVF